MRKSYAYLSSHIHLTHIESNPSNLVSLHKIRKTHSDIASAFRALSYPIYHYHPSYLLQLYSTIRKIPNLSPTSIESYIHIYTKTHKPKDSNPIPNRSAPRRPWVLKEILYVDDIMDTAYKVRYSKSITSIFSASHHIYHLYPDTLKAKPHSTFIDTIPSILYHIFESFNLLISTRHSNETDSAHRNQWTLKPLLKRQVLVYGAEEKVQGGEEIGWRVLERYGFGNVNVKGRGREEREEERGKKKIDGWE